MLDTITQMSMSPPNKGGNIALAADFPDDIRELGDRIAALSVKEAAALAAYLSQLGVK
jgi:hypothetical protein